MCARLPRSRLRAGSQPSACSRESWPFLAAPTGAAAGTTERVSMDSAGNEGNGGSGGPAISADGRFVAFASYASNLVPGDTNGGADVVVHDRQTGTTERMIVDSAGNAADGSSGGDEVKADVR